MSYFELGEERNRPYFDKAPVALLGPGTQVANAGVRNSKFIFVYKGELEVSQIVDFDERDMKKHDEVMFYVSEGEAVRSPIHFCREYLNFRSPSDSRCLLPFHLIMKC
jgi:hypothetical protein